MEIDLRTRLPLVALVLLLAAVGMIETVAHLEQTGPGWDAKAYWGAWSGSMYDGSVGSPGQYLYSPAFAQAVWPLTHTSWQVFAASFIVFNAVGLAWLLRPLPLTLTVPLWLAGSQEVLAGNVFIPMAIVAVLGMRLPRLWAFVALTKVTPCLGPVWFAARGEWASVLRAAVATVAIVLVSWLVAPDLWRDWIHFLTGQAGIADGAAGYGFFPGPLYRLPVAVVLVVVAARTDRVWLLPVCMVLATPFIWNGSLTLLAAIPRLTAVRNARIRSDLPDSPAPTRRHPARPDRPGSPGHDRLAEDSKGRGPE